MYISITKGKRSAFKNFLCKGNDSTIIDGGFLKDTGKSLRLYRCFYEAKDKKRCFIIEKKFSAGTSLLKDMQSPIIEDIITMLTCSKIKNWELLSLDSCHIQDHGVQLLQRGLKNSGITIAQINLHKNALTSLSNTFLFDIILTCKVKALNIKENVQWIRNDKDVEETKQFITTILLSPAILLEELTMANNNYRSNKWAIHLYIHFIKEK